MIDFKMQAAADDREENLLPHGLSDKYVKIALAELLTFTRAEMSDDERLLWEKRLSTVPLWKLKRVNEYTGPFINGVWAFFDTLRYVERSVKALPEPAPAPRSVQIARDMNAHIQALMSFKGSREERLKWERDSLMNLDKKYPHLGLWDQMRREKRFDNAGA